MLATLRPHCSVLANHFCSQLHRISHRSSPKLAHVSGNLLFVRVLSWALDRVAPLRTRSQTPAKQGFSLARPTRLATPCEAKRRVAAPDFAPLLRSGRRSPAGSASPRWAANSLSQVKCIRWGVKCVWHNSRVNLVQPKETSRSKHVA